MFDCSLEVPHWEVENGKIGPLLYHVSMYVRIFHYVVIEYTSDCGDCEASDICPLI